MRILLLILMLGFYAFADSITLPDNFKADFTQKITNAKKKVINYNGKVYFSDKKLQKWEFLKPTKKEVCTTDKKLIVVDHDLEQVSNYRIKKGFNLKKILAKAKLHKKNIYVATYLDIRYTIQLDAKGHLHSFAFFDELDNKVQIVFKKIKYGKGKLSKKTMSCPVPKGYDVIRG